MASFFAYLIGGVWIAEHWQIVVAVLAALILLIVILHRRKKARMAAYLALPVIYVGNKSTHTFHRPGCSTLSSLAPANTIHFRTVDEVRRYGYSPCNICKP